MSVPKIENLNYCRTWSRICNSFGDVAYQRRCWFRMENPNEVSSYEEDFAHMDFATQILSEAEQDVFLNNSCNLLIKKLVEKLYKYNSDPETFLNPADEDDLLNDPKWIEITKIAQEAEAALKEFEQEVTNVQG